MGYSRDVTADMGETKGPLKIQGAENMRRLWAESGHSKQKQQNFHLPKHACVGGTGATMQRAAFRFLSNLVLGLH